MNNILINQVALLLYHYLSFYVFQEFELLNIYIPVISDYVYLY